MHRQVALALPLLVLIGCTAVRAPLAMSCRAGDALLGLLCSDAQSLDRMHELLASSGYSRLPTERAAFLIAGPGGTFEWITWPRTVAFHRASYRGLIPPRTMAIVHTHPSHLPDPSAADAGLARRLGIPIVAVTSRAFTIVWPDGVVNRTKVGPRERPAKGMAPDLRSAIDGPAN